jgi:hypothetical protein
MLNQVVLGIGTGYWVLGTGYLCLSEIGEHFIFLGRMKYKIRKISDIPVLDTWYQMPNTYEVASVLFQHFVDADSSG